MQQTDLLKELSDIEDKLVVQGHRLVAKRQNADIASRTSSKERQNATAITAIMTDKGLREEAPVLVEGIRLCRKLRVLAKKGTLGAYAPEFRELRRITNGLPPI